MPSKPKKDPNSQPPKTAQVEEITRRTYLESATPTANDEPDSDLQGKMVAFDDDRFFAKVYRIDDKNTWRFVFRCEPSLFTEELVRERCPHADYFAVQMIDRTKGKGNIAYSTKFRLEPEENNPTERPTMEVVSTPGAATSPDTLHDFLMLTIEQMRESHDERMRAQADREKSFTSMVTQIMPLVTGRQTASGDSLDQLSKLWSVIKEFKAGDDVGSILKRMKEMDELKGLFGNPPGDDFSWGTVFKGLAAHILPLVLPLVSKLATTIPGQPAAPATPLLENKPVLALADTLTPAPVQPPPAPVPTLVKPNGSDKRNATFQKFIPIVLHAIESEDVDYAFDWISTILEAQGETAQGQELIRYAFADNTLDTLAALYPELARPDFKELYDRLSAELLAPPDADRPADSKTRNALVGDPGSRTDNPGDEKSSA
jgi:hypothetical protein